MNDSEFLKDLAERYRREFAMDGPPDRPKCLSLPRLAAAAALADWTAAELDHVQSCQRCRKLLVAEYRMECPDMGVLVPYVAGLSPFTAAIQAHIEEDACPRCARRVAARWTVARAALLRAGELSKEALRDMVHSMVDGPVHLAAQPAFLSESGANDLQETHIAGSEGLLRVILRHEGPMTVVYIEATGPALAGRTAVVELMSDRGRVEARIRLGLAEGIGAFGRGDLGRSAAILADLGPDCQLFASVE